MKSRNWLVFKYAREFGALFLWVTIEFGFLAETRLIQGSNDDLDLALRFLKEYDAEASDVCFRVSLAQWNYATNMTDANKRKMIEQQTHKAKFDKVSWKAAAQFAWDDFPDAKVRRQLKFLVTNGRASLPDDKYNEIHHLVAEMKEIYSQVRVCAYNNTSNFCDLDFESDVFRVMANSKNSDELLHFWREWHDKVGPPMKNKYMRYVQLANQAARMIGFENAAEQMQYIYEDDDFDYEIQETFQKLLPLYKQLFTYVRRKLALRFGTGVVSTDGAIPAHLFGNIWAQDWSNLYDILVPFKTSFNKDAKEEMLRSGFTPIRMFKLAEEFYTSLGLKPLPPEFWQHSMIEKPIDRRVQCTSSAWDFCNKVDFRIKQCTEVDLENLLVTHHEMAHIQYYMQYKEQPFLYRDGANPGFHEAVGDSIILSVYNPTHLQKIGLLNNTANTFEATINFLLKIALKKIPFLPFAFVLNQWRANVFKYGVQNMNALWWELRLRNQGIVPPVARNEFFFDPGAKKHIPYDLPYIRYYVAILLEFQIFESLCQVSRHKGQLHKCDFYRSREAGKILGEAMRVGKSRHWKDVVRMITNGKSERLSADAMIKYFEPLTSWLRMQNKDESVIGWRITSDDMRLFQTFKDRNCAKNAKDVNCVLFVVSVIFIMKFK